MTVAISICKRCGRFQGADAWQGDTDFEGEPWCLTETDCERCEWVLRAKVWLRTRPLPALLGLLAFAGFGLVLSLT